MKRLIIIILPIILFFVSCKKEIKTKREEVKGIIEKPIEYSVKFPDTVFINELNDGVITYKSKLDTIITTFGDSQKNRYTRFILTATKNPNYDFEHLK